MAVGYEKAVEVELELTEESSSDESIIYLSPSISEDECDGVRAIQMASHSQPNHSLSHDPLPNLMNDSDDGKTIENAATVAKAYKHSGGNEMEAQLIVTTSTLPDLQGSDSLPGNAFSFHMVDSNGKRYDGTKTTFRTSAISSGSNEQVNASDLKPKKRQNRQRRRRQRKPSQNSPVGEATTHGQVYPQYDQAAGVFQAEIEHPLDSRHKVIQSTSRRNISTGKDCAKQGTVRTQRSRRSKQYTESVCGLVEWSQNVVTDQSNHPKSKPKGLVKGECKSLMTSQPQQEKPPIKHRSFATHSDQSRKSFNSERRKKHAAKEKTHSKDLTSLSYKKPSTRNFGNDPVESEDPALLLADLANQIQAMKSSAQSKHDREVFEHKTELSKYDQTATKKRLKYHTPDKHELIQCTKKNLKKSIAECGLVKEALFAFCAELEEDIQNLQSASPSLISSSCKILQKKFERECYKYDNPLPMYSKRNDILMAVQNHSTCVVIGETGSGKSTQLVQYLYEAGYAEHGIIACTQPRKLAARSLAEHVSKEVGERKGTTYSYYGTDSKSNRKAKVAFMTDHMLLNECIADRRLSKYSVVVIDEAHERSIHTDILIALIKRCLPDRQDLKVIVTSATINPTLFSEYFGGPYDCPIIEVPGRVYPVVVFYQPPSPDTVLQRKYVKESVEQAYDIHLNNKAKPGDILVFLTSPVEIEQACKYAQSIMKDEILVLPLHGKLEPEEQQKVFDGSFKKRKVVFSTNVAETSVTIPGIKYVIDTGLSKEMRYDAQRNMNSLEIRPISKSSANQRKGRAGRTGPGECHRLFSEMEYSSMREDSTPEILRISLAFAVIKLYEFGIDDVHSFEFVDAPDRKALDDAVKILNFHGAIADGKLTSLGKQMALLPLEPNLSKLLLDSISNGIGSAGAASVSISSLAGQVFFRPMDELKDQSDQLRLPFCQESGDQMTNLCVYFEWSKQAKKDRSLWCKENFVNGKSMRMVKELVEELTMILKNKCHIQISPSLDSVDGVEAILPKLIFDSFLNNLSIHLGHSKVGYWCDNYPNEQLVLHYGSSLNYLGEHPPCVVFEKTQKTSQNFMLQIMPVKEEWIASAIDSKKLSCHPAESSLYSIYRVSKLVISNLGPIIISELRKKYNPDRRIAVREFRGYEIQPIFEYSKEKGELTIISQQFYRDEIKAAIMNFVGEIKQKRKEDTYKDGIVGENDDVRIIIQEGGVIQRVLMPDEFQGIKVLNLPSIERYVASEELQEYGNCTIECSKIANDQTVTLIVKYEQPSEARLALQHKFEKFEDPRVCIQSLQQRTKNRFNVRISWPRRERRNFAYINFTEDEFKHAIISHLDEGCISFRDDISSLNFQVMEEKDAIRVQGLLPHMDADYVRSRLCMHCPAVAADKDIFFLYEKPFEETREMYLDEKLRLNDALSEIIPRGSYFIDFHFPKEKSTFYIAYVHFDNSDDSLTVQERLDDEFNAKMLLSFSLRFSPKIFSVIKPSIETISTNNPGMISYDRKDYWGNIFVKVTASNMDSFIDARDRINFAAEPETITFDEKEGKYSCTAIFMKAVRKIESDTSTHIKWQNFNVSNHTLCIYGTGRNKTAAKLKIREHLLKKLSDVGFFEIDLKAYASGAMKHIVLMYGPDAGKITEKYEGVRATKIDIRRHTLFLFSDEVSYRAIQETLKEFSSVSHNSISHTQHEADGDIECCVCYEKHHSTATFYRLEYCGHIYCKDCIKHQLEPQTILFPVVCAAESCGQNFVWADFDSLIKSKTIRLRDLKSAALKHFVATHSNVYHHCSTPDCDMIYAITEEGERFVCNQCGANICSHCHGGWHEGYDTCAAYQRRNDKDTVVDDWMRRNMEGRKRCPNCDVPIEKNGGCRQVLCIKCNAKICWICSRFYKTSEECYDHLTRAHGGIFDADAM